MLCLDLREYYWCRWKSKCHIVWID